MKLRLRTVSLAVTVVALMLLGAALVQAAIVTLNNVDGTWSNAAGSPTCLRYNNTANTTDENQVAYGSSSYPISCPSSLDLTRQSGFGFNGTNGPLPVETGEIFLLGELTHYNRPIYATNPFTTVDLDIALQFSGLPTSTLSFEMRLDETPNDTPCDYPGNTICPDKVDFSTTVGEETFWIDGKRYTLAIVGFVPGTAATCEYDANSTINQFITEEGQENYACLFGRLVVDEPAIDVEKLVWDGTDWVDADTAPGPYLMSLTNPQFKFVITNTGNVELTNVDLIDDVYGDIALNGTLAPGASLEYLHIGTWTVGPHVNTATVTGEYGGNTYTDSDDAHYFGAAPALTLVKTASPTTYDAVTDVIN
jgi:hypothetical protein